jgi:hypothetical protein
MPGRDTGSALARLPDRNECDTAVRRSTNDERRCHKSCHSHATGAGHLYGGCPYPLLANLSAGSRHGGGGSRKRLAGAVGSIVRCCGLSLTRDRLGVMALRTPKQCSTGRKANSGPRTRDPDAGAILALKMLQIGATNTPRARSRLARRSQRRLHSTIPLSRHVIRKQPLASSRSFLV